MVVGLLGILKAGGAYVPLDPAYPAARLAFMLKDSAPVALLTDSASRAALAGEDLAVPVIDLAEAQLWAGEPAVNPDCAALGLNSRHLAYVIYTSGSTGTPKGVMVEHRQLCNQIVSMRAHYSLNREDRILQFASLTFDISVEEIFGAWRSGALLVLRTDDWLAAPKKFWALCGKHAITVLSLPTQFFLSVALQRATRQFPPACGKLSLAAMLSQKLVLRFGSRGGGGDLCFLIPTVPPKRRSMRRSKR